LFTVSGLSDAKSCILKLPREVSSVAVYFLVLSISMAGGLDQDITLEGAGCDGDIDWEDWEGEAGDVGVGVLEVGVDGEGEGLGAGDGVGAAPPAHPTAKMATPTSITVTNFLTLFIFMFRPSPAILFLNIVIY